MSQIILILLISLLPSLLYLLITHHIKHRWQARLRRAHLSMNYYRQRARNPSSINHHLASSFPDYFIGDPSCVYNAHSAYLRCTVNPHGPCDNCSHYEPKSREEY